MVLKSLSQNLKEIIFKKSCVREQYERFNDLCEEKIWKKLLSENICELNKQLKNQFKDKFLMYFSIKNNFCYVIRRLTIFSVFEHLHDCTKVCDTMRIEFVLL